MGHHHDEDEAEGVAEHGHAGGFLGGALLGGLVGVGVGLLLAPASGQDTRHRLRDRAIAVRDEARQAAEEARARAEDLQSSGREMLEQNRRRVIRTAEAVKQSAQEAWSGKSQGGEASTVQTGTVESKSGEVVRSSTGSFSPRS